MTCRGIYPAPLGSSLLVHKPSSGSSGNRFRTFASWAATFAFYGVTWSASARLSAGNPNRPGPPKNDLVPCPTFRPSSATFVPVVWNRDADLPSLKEGGPSLGKMRGPEALVAREKHNGCLLPHLENAWLSESFLKSMNTVRSSRSTNLEKLCSRLSGLLSDRKSNDSFLRERFLRQQKTRGPNRPVALSKAKATHALGVSVRTIDNCIAQKGIRVMRIGRRVLVPMHSIEAALKHGALETHADD
jgi:hypothetical protein